VSLEEPEPHVKGHNVGFSGMNVACGIFYLSLEESKRKVFEIEVVNLHEDG
jgi:hypothetical protein